MSDETKPGETAEIDSNTSKADLKAAADDILKSAPKQEDAPEAQVDVDPVQRLEIEKEELREQLLRTLADLDNTRKRAERQVSDARVYAIEKFAGDLLSVSDNLSRALAALTDEDRAALSEAGRNLFEGIEMTEKELHTALARHGVTVIAALPGDTFDPNLHQAVANIPSDQPNGTIASCFQPGWKIGERTLRAAMVAVSAGAAN
ncbi:MAG: nucleotide exchange factor GrpE [Hyphomonas sp.]|jgi:molecular chaperone GrpE|uniref:nucleotide exchange factor GrpE n=1 Tax=Hyphomonas sp. TaxID=87 RepID=UPI001B181F6F|nr:nucleotide exchange factor GrpE [Hyphomonas sp.]MBO6584077.1 nucleotide exchange factor GrpE [Hyphomonas sp.]